MASIIVVDDEVLVRELFGIWLDETGHTVRTAGSTTVAREMLTAESADVMVCDVGLARSSELDLLAWAQRNQPGMPVVLMTGKPAVETAVEALRFGAYDYLVKPVDHPDLLRVIERASHHAKLLHEKQRLECENENYRRQLEDSVAQRTEALRRRNQQLLLINDVAATIGALDEPPILYRKVVDAVHETFGYADVGLFEVDYGRGLIVLRASCSDRPDTEHAVAYEQPLDEGVLGEVVQRNQSIIVTDVEERPEVMRGRQRDDIRSEAIFPVSLDGRLVALISVSEKRPDAFDEVDTLVLRTLVDHLGVALANARLYSRLQDALEARDNMLANVSHELRSPLSVIVAWAEMLNDSSMIELGADARRAAGSILLSAGHLSHLVNLLLTFQRLEREEMHVGPIAIGELLREGVESLRPILAESGVDLTMSIDPDVGDVTGNADYLRQVLNNLLDNARKFSPDGGRAFVQATRADDKVLVSVSDEGVGVSADKLSRLFERFYQADGGMSRRFEGMGLGLSLSQDIVERHGGRIWAESEGEGQGLTITFELPVHGAEMSVQNGLHQEAG